MTWRTTLEVLAGNGVEALIDAADGFTPTPAVSHAILRLNRAGAQADGILITPSHNPPRDGGFKYNPPSGGPAGSDATSAIAARANALLERGLKDVRRAPFARTFNQAGRYDFIGRYVDDLPSILDLEVVRRAGVKIGADPLRLDAPASREQKARLAELNGLSLALGSKPQGELGTERLPTRLAGDLAVVGQAKRAR